MTSRPHTLVLPFGDHARRVRVLVPRDAESIPPVLVLFDGQNVLDDRGTRCGWHAHHAIEKLPSTVRRPVLVAIDHGADRIHELWTDLDALLRFVLVEALPAAEHCVGTRFDPRARVVGGSSLGGLASLAGIARHPDVFSGAMAMSPSAWFARDEILRELDRARVHATARFYVDVGYRESDAMVHATKRVSRLLTARTDRSQFLFRPDRRGKHHERDWKRRLPKALRFLFRR